ncbi:hypothetical protein GCM10023192_23830 [Amycolatopsis samaneae]
MPRNDFGVICPAVQGTHPGFGFVPDVPDQVEHTARPQTAPGLPGTGGRLNPAPACPGHDGVEAPGPERKRLGGADEGGHAGNVVSMAGSGSSAIASHPVAATGWSGRPVSWIPRMDPNDLGLPRDRHGPGRQAQTSADKRGDRS